MSLLNQRCEVLFYDCYSKLVNKSVLWNVKKLCFRLKSRQRHFVGSVVIDLKFLLGNLQKVAEIQPKCTWHKRSKSILLRQIVCNFIVTERAMYKPSDKTGTAVWREKICAHAQFFLVLQSSYSMYLTKVIHFLSMILRPNKGLISCSIIVVW